MDLNSINMPQALKESTGSSFHGTVSGGSYKFRIWTYPQFYTDAAGVKTYYIPAKKFIMLPPDPEFKLVFGAVPTLVTDNRTNSPLGIANRRGKYVIQDIVDVTRQAHYYSIKSCPVGVPVEVNSIYTAQVLA